MYWITDEVAVSGFHDMDLAPPVSAVLCVADERPYEPRPSGNIRWLHLGFPDVQPFPLDRVWECVKWLDARVSEGRKVLVHCAEGNSRSVSVVAAYLLFKGWRVEEVKALVLAKKPFACLAGYPTRQAQYFQERFLLEWDGFLRDQSTVHVNSPR